MGNNEFNGKFATQLGKIVVVHRYIISAYREDFIWGNPGPTFDLGIRWIATKQITFFLAIMVHREVLTSITMTCVLHHHYLNASCLNDCRLLSGERDMLRLQFNHMHSKWVCSVQVAQCASTAQCHMNDTCCYHNTQLAIPSDELIQSFSERTHSLSQKQPIALPMHPSRSH